VVVHRSKRVADCAFVRIEDIVLPWMRMFGWDKDVALVITGLAAYDVHTLIAVLDRVVGDANVTPEMIGRDVLVVKCIDYADALRRVPDGHECLPPMMVFVDGVVVWRGGRCWNAL